jgi:hypothetical protein
VPVAAIIVSTLLFRQKNNAEAAYAAPLLQACQFICERVANSSSLLVIK